MISIVICSRNPNVPHELREQIQRTVGAEYELIVLDNSVERRSIFSVYNDGISRASGEIVCFMHDDVRFLTQDWGKNAMRHFDDDATGLIGIAGGKYLPAFPCYWFNNPNDRCINIIQHSDRPGCIVHDYINPSDSVSTDVVAVDGVWFCIRKSLFDTISFDEDCYCGFHIYDLDICMQVIAAGYRCKVVYDVLIEHLSIGFGGSKWMDSALLFVSKWERDLPVYSADFSWSPSRKKDCWRAFADVLGRMRRMGYPQATIRKIFRTSIVTMPLTLSRNIPRVFLNSF